MKPFLLGAMLFVFLGSAGCAVSVAESVPQYAGQQLYTQFNMWYDKERIHCVNYSISQKIPVNTPVTIVSVDSEKIVFYENDTPGHTVFIFNKEKFSHASSAELVKRHFAPTKVNLAAFTPEEQTFINQFDGYWVPGIRKEAVIVARGYPSPHRTPSVENNEWIYWRNKWVSKTIGFVNGKVATVNGRPITGPTSN